MNDAEAIEMALAYNCEGLRAIPAKYAKPSPDKVGVLKKGGMDLPYQGHAEVTLDLIDIDPAWTVDIASDAGGAWIVRESAREATIFGTMTVLGVSRPCVGTVDLKVGSNDNTDLYKKLYSEIIKNGAMRFGIATQLWSKAEGRESGATQPATTIGQNEASALVEHLKTLDDDLKTSVKQQLSALADTTNIAQIPVDMLGSVLRIVLGASAEQAKRVPK